MIYKRGGRHVEADSPIDVDELELLDSIRATGARGLRIVERDLLVANSLYLRGLIAPVLPGEDGCEHPWTYEATVKGRCIEVPCPAPSGTCPRNWTRDRNVPVEAPIEKTRSGGDDHELEFILAFWPSTGQGRSSE